MEIEKTTKYKVFKKYKSSDNVNWIEADPEEEKYIAWEQNSVECGYIPPITGGTTGDTGTTTGSTTGDTGSTTGSTTGGTTERSETVITYTDGTRKTYSLKGTLNRTDIDDGRFVVTVDIGTGITSIGDSAIGDGTIFDTTITSVTIPNSVTSIGRDVFGGCGSLVSITIPNSVRNIGDSAFAGSSIASIMFDGTIKQWNAITKGSNWAVKGIFVHCIDGNVNIYGKTIGGTSGRCETIVTYTDGIANEFGMKGHLSNISIGNKKNSIIVDIGTCITGIGYSAFGGCKSLASITIPDSVTSIGNYAFDGCKSLASITIPYSVASIGNYAFQGCSSLTSITIPSGVTSIGIGTFSGCTSLTSVTIPNSVTSIGKQAFRVCSSLTSINFEGTTSQWNAIDKGSEWNNGVPATVVHCTDGDITL